MNVVQSIIFYMFLACVSGGKETVLQTRDPEIQSHSFDSNKQEIGGNISTIQGGAGEGNQSLTPHGSVPNQASTKSFLPLPSYCTPPNPCPIGYTASKNCIPMDSPEFEYDKNFIRIFQDTQNCRCDSDHDDCRRRPEKHRIGSNRFMKLLEKAKARNHTSTATATTTTSTTQLAGIGSTVSSNSSQIAALSSNSSQELESNNTNYSKIAM